MGFWGAVMKTKLAILAAFLGMTTGAYAADMAVKAPGAPVVYNWSGCYLGGEGGWSMGRSQEIGALAPFVGVPVNNGFDMNGALAGFTFGCNLQYQNYVFGLEDDVYWTNLHGRTGDVAPFNVAATNETRLDWANTVRPRIGYAFDRFMIYGTAGVALARTQVLVSLPAFGSVSDHQNRSGWVAGAGAEWAVYTGPFVDLTLKAEYLHGDYNGDLGTQKYFNTPVALGTTAVITREARLTTDTVRFGVNLKFNSGSSTPPVKQ
jgi:outer membrane immunogenic protein